MFIHNRSNYSHIYGNKFILDRHIVIQKRPVKDLLFFYQKQYFN